MSSGTLPLPQQQNFTSSLPQRKAAAVTAASNVPILLDPMPSTTRRSRRVTIGSETTTKKTGVIDLSQDDDNDDLGPPSKRLRASTGSSRTLLGVLSSSSCNQRANANSKKMASPVAAKRRQQQPAAAAALPRNNNNDENKVPAVGAKTTSTTTTTARRSSAGSKQEAVTEQKQPPKISKPVRKPTKGDRFQVFFDMGDDVFGKQRAGAKGWYFGTLQKSKKKNSAVFEIQVRFDNGELFTFDYPAQDGSIERLVPSSEGDCVYMGEFSEQFAVHTNPTILDVGDLVQCLYQNGSCNGEWYRGRVAAVTADKQFCDVAYDDGEYEINVPLGQAKIMLLQDGRRFQHWLDGVKLHVPIGKTSKRMAEVTIRVLADDNDGDDSMVKLQHHDETIETKPYTEVVRQLFDEAKQCAKTILDWPSAILQSKPKPATNIKSKAATTTSTAKAKNSKKRKVPPAATAALPTGPAQACHADDFVVDPWLSDPLSEDEAEEDLEEEEPTVAMKEMTNSVRNSCWQMFNSAEGPYGFDLLFQITEFHNKMPNEELCRDLIHLLWKGPTHANGRIQFPDCVRMELANKYLSLLKTKPGMGTKLAKALKAKEFWTNVLDSIREPAVVYCVEGDENRSTSAALTRIGQTLNVKNSGAHLFRYLLQHQLRGYSQFKKDGVSKQQLEGFKNLLMSRPLTCDILSADEGITHALKRAVRAAFSVLIHYGHYLSNDFCFPDPPEATKEDANLVPPHATAADRAFVAAEVRKLLEAMGRIVGYMAWLWSIEEGQSIYAAKYVISGSVTSQLEDAKFDPSMFLTKAKSAKDKEKRMNRHWSDMKLQFALSLDKRINGQLGRLVAEEFNILTKNELKLMFG